MNSPHFSVLGVVDGMVQFVWPVKQIGAAMSAATHAHPFLCMCKSLSAGCQTLHGCCKADMT